MRGRYYETVYEESCSVPMSEILPIVREASLALSCVIFYWYGNICRTVLQ